jgi:hypothetical protein
MGAPLTPEDTAAVVGYLAANHGKPAAMPRIIVRSVQNGHQRKADDTDQQGREQADRQRL